MDFIKKLAPDLRIIGFFEKIFVPKFYAHKSKKLNTLFRKILQGKWLGKHSSMQEQNIARDDGSLMRLLVVKSKNPVSNAPGILWIHGGGYGIGIPEQAFGYMDTFCDKGNCVVVSPDYTLSYEASYPAALEDCYLALKWMKENGAELGILLDKIFVGGESAGGGLAISLALYARDKGEIPIAYQMPFYPMIDDRMITFSSKNNKMPVWDTSSNERAWKAYLGALYGSENIPPYAAPARETDYKNLPPCCTFAGTVEPFHDEIVHYVKNLKEAGIHVDFMEFSGCYHAFDMLAPFSKEAKSAKKFYLESFLYAIEHYVSEQK